MMTNKVGLIPHLFFLGSVLLNHFFTILCRGLLASKMYETAKGIVINLISMIDEFGHVLNGARVYYTNRR